MADFEGFALSPPPRHLVEEAVRNALAEDLGLAGDLTSDLLIPADQIAAAAFVARAEGRLAGLPLAEAAFRLIDGDVRFEALVPEGSAVAPGTVLAKVQGKARALLKAERVALNFLGLLSGIATKTAQFVRAIDGTGAKIVCTRKTTPGLRAFEKYAVRAGGGHNHRFGLFDAILIKDNHIAACGGIGAAIEKALAGAGHLVKIEVEVDNIAQLREAVLRPIHAVLLDNMKPADLAEAVRIAKAKRPGLICEASGGVTLDTVRAIAETGVDLISAGSLTHSVASLDIGLDF
jgi:nicotinate-nucleotide pyrophosphorylase (carboxylating)